MRDVVKRNVKRNESRKRTRRRRRNMPLYIFLVFILVLAIGATLSVTLFFNIKNIKVVGESDYLNEDIIRVSGIENGDNLVRLDAAGAEKHILASMVYIEEVDVKKKYPDSIEIEVTKSQVAACVSCDDGYLLVSEKGRVLDKVGSTDGSIMRIDGFEPANENLGSVLKSKDSQKDDIVLEALSAVFSQENQLIKSVDMTDKYDIKVNFDNRIIFSMGNSNDILYKIELAQTVVEEMSSDKSGTMTMVGTNQISFRGDDSVEQNKGSSPGRIPVSENDMPNEDSAHPGDELNSSNNEESEYSDENSQSEQDSEEWQEEPEESNEYEEENYNEDSEYYNDEEQYLEDNNEY